MKKKLLFIMLLCLVVLFLIGCGLRKIGQAKPSNLGDDVVIYRDELKECCVYEDEFGNEKTCTVLKTYDCSYCDEYCKK